MAFPFQKEITDAAIVFFAQVLPFLWMGHKILAEKIAKGVFNHPEMQEGIMMALIAGTTILAWWVFKTSVAVTQTLIRVALYLIVLIVISLAIGGVAYFLL
jgi:hypothetical protein